MTVSSTTPSITYVYTGPGEYDFSFRTYTEADIAVYLTGSDGLVSTLIPNVDYVVTLDPGFNGGTVDILTPVTPGGTLRIRRELVIEQTVDWQNNDPLDEAILERSFDRMVMILQQQDVIVTEGRATTNWRGDWTTAAGYETQDVVTGPDANIYVCVEAHTAGVFATDLSAGYWMIAADISEVATAKAAAEAAAADAAADAATVAADKAIVAADKATVAADKATVQGLASQVTTDAGNASDDADAAAASAALAASIVNVGVQVGYDMTGLSAKTLDASLYDVFELHGINTNFTITVSNMVAGRTITIFIDGGDSNTITWPSGWYWTGGAVIDHTAGVDAYVVTMLTSGKIVAGAALNHATP